MPSILQTLAVARMTNDREKLSLPMIDKWTFRFAAKLGLGATAHSDGRLVVGGQSIPSEWRAVESFIRSR